MKKEIRIHRDIPVCTIIIAVGFIFLVEAQNYPIETARFPIFFAAIMVVLTLVVLIGAIRKSIEVTKRQENVTDEYIKREDLKSPLSFALAIGLYVSGICYIGFFVSTAVFIVGFLLLQGYKDIKKAVILAIGGDLVLYLLFVMVLGVPLPAELLF